MKTFLYAIGGFSAFIAVIVLLFGIRLGGIQLNGILRQAVVEQDNRVFRESTQYIEGTRSEFERLKMDWERNGNIAVCNSLETRFLGNSDILLQEQRDYLERLRCT